MPTSLSSTWRPTIRVRRSNSSAPATSRSAASSATTSGTCTASRSRTASRPWADPAAGRSRRLNPGPASPSPVGFGVLRRWIKQHDWAFTSTQAAAWEQAAGVECRQADSGGVSQVTDTHLAGWASWQQPVIPGPGTSGGHDAPSPSVRPDAGQAARPAAISSPAAGCRASQDSSPACTVTARQLRPGGACCTWYGACSRHEQPSRQRPAKPGAAAVTDLRAVAQRPGADHTCQRTGEPTGERTGLRCAAGR